MTNQATTTAATATATTTKTQGQLLAQHINESTDHAKQIVGLDHDTVLAGKGKSKVTPATIEAATLQAEQSAEKHEADKGTLWNELRALYLVTPAGSFKDTVKAITNSLKWGRAPKGSSEAERDQWRPTPRPFKNAVSLLNRAHDSGITVKADMGQTELSKKISAAVKAAKKATEAEKAESDAEGDTNTKGATEANAAAQAVDSDSDLYPLFKALAHKYGKANKAEKDAMLEELAALAS